MVSRLLKLKKKRGGEGKEEEEREGGEETWIKIKYGPKSLKYLSSAYLQSLANPALK